MADRPDTPSHGTDLADTGGAAPLRRSVWLDDAEADAWELEASPADPPAFGPDPWEASGDAFIAPPTPIPLGALPGTPEL